MGLQCHQRLMMPMHMKGVCVCVCEAFLWSCLCSCPTSHNTTVTHTEHQDGCHEQRDVSKHSITERDSNMSNSVDISHLS